MKVALKQYSRLLSKYLRPHWPMALMFSVLLFGNIGLQLVNPQILRQFIDATQAGLAPETLLRTALLFFGIALAQQVISVLATYLGESLSWATTNTLRADLADHCLQLDMSFHNARTPGEMIERVDGDVTSLAHFLSRFVAYVVGNMFLLLGVLVLLFREDWRVGVALGAFVLAALFVAVRLRNIAVPHWTASRQANADMFGFLEERLAGTEDIRACGAKQYVMRRFHQLMRTIFHKELRASLVTNMMVNTSVVMLAVGNAVALAVGAYLFEAGVITIGTVYMFFHYSNLIMGPIRAITHQMESLQQAGAGVSRVQELFHMRSRLEDQAGETADSVALPMGALAVEFDDVCFGYEAGERAGEPVDLDIGKPAPETVLHNLSFRLEPGTVLGLLGRTGSGKTTLTRLLFRLYDPDSGAICLGTALTDIRQVSLFGLRQRIGMVTQNIQLFHASVRDNLTFFDMTVPDERILQVIDDLGMGEWYRSLPEGLDSELESGGGGLSAGEAQLLAFARIFLKDPGLVILDEASSRLDPATESLIERAVDRLVRNRTAIIVAHRLGTVQRADRIMILEDGRIDEHGSRVELASDSTSRFYSLLQTGLEEVLA